MEQWRMNEVLGAFSAQEAVAVVLALVYIALVQRQNSWCWLAALVSETMFIGLCLRAQLFAETFLHVFYWFMAIYGWWSWRQPRHAVQIHTWPWHRHLVVCLSGGLLVLFLGHQLALRTSAALPYLDSFTTVFSLITTYMVARKVLENWLYWIVVDLASAYLYANRALYLTAILNLIFTVIVVFGFMEWRRVWKTEHESIV
ncbi:MAG: nicotinamide mononucleotide transporter [Cytophagales bacterium]|nr:nicotinamide mononucleotide transporter [Cytophagales bacterium]